MRIIALALLACCTTAISADKDRCMDQAALNAFSLNILAGIVVAIISALTATHLALKRFRTEKWWERKVDAYSRIIEALHNSKTWTEEHLKAAFEEQEIPEEKKNELTARARAAHDEIRKAINVGGFLLSDEALNRLRLFEKESSKRHETWFDYLESDLSVTDACLNDIIEIAKNDLKTK